MPLTCAATSVQSTFFVVKDHGSPRRESSSRWNRCWRSRTCSPRRLVLFVSGERGVPCCSRAVIPVSRNSGTRSAVHLRPPIITLLSATRTLTPCRESGRNRASAASRQNHFSFYSLLAHGAVSPPLFLRLPLPFSSSLHLFTG